jgi:hypothetical protein
MTFRDMARTDGPQHASAVHRLAGAQNEWRRLKGLFEAATGSRSEPLAWERLGAARARVAAQKEWLHWIEAGESLAPWADGEWGTNAAVDMTAPFPFQARAGLRGMRARSVARSASRARASERRART